MTANAQVCATLTKLWELHEEDERIIAELERDLQRLGCPLPRKEV